MITPVRGPLHFVIDTGPDGTDVTHLAAAMRAPKGEFASTYAVSMCGIAFQNDDPWVMGFSPDPDERVTCPRCLEIWRTTDPRVL